MTEDHGFEALLNPGEAENFFSAGDLAPFDPSGRDFNRANALWLAEFCRLSYRRERDELPGRAPGFRTRDQILTTHGWRERAVVRTSRGVPQAAFLERSGSDGTVLVFRGTLGLQDLLTDVRWALRPWSGDGHVHEGFKEALDGLWPGVRTRLREVRGPIFLTGHSLGGALATMTAVLCRRELPSHDLAALYTFGSPRVGDRVFGAALQGAPHFRVVNDLDVIPRLPPVIPNPVLPCFEHAGRLQHLVDGRARVYPPGVDPFVDVAGLPALIELQRALTNRAGTPGKLPPFLADHAPVNHVTRLARLPA